MGHHKHSDGPTSYLVPQRLSVVGPADPSDVYTLTCRRFLSSESLCRVWAAAPEIWPFPLEKKSQHVKFYSCVVNTDPWCVSTCV